MTAARHPSHDSQTGLTEVTAPLQLVARPAANPAGCERGETPTAASPAASPSRAVPQPPPSASLSVNPQLMGHALLPPKLTSEVAPAKPLLERHMETNNEHQTGSFKSLAGHH